MSNVTLAMQGAIVTALKAATELHALLGNGAAGNPCRVYDVVPDGVAFPFVSVGPAQVNRQDAECINGREVFQQVDVWSRDVAHGHVEAKRIGGIIEDMLHDFEASNGGLAFTIEHRFSTYQRDGDGLTAHGVLSFRAEIDTEKT
jgi:hypothetical protein